VFLFSFNFCLKHFLFWEEMSELSKMYIDLHVKYSLFLSDFNETWIFSIFKKYSNIKFHENPSSGSQVVPCGPADVMKLIVAFHNLVNCLKIMCAKEILQNENHHINGWKDLITQSEVLCVLHGSTTHHKSGFQNLGGVL